MKLFALLCGAMFLFGCTTSEPAPAVIEQPEKATEQTQVAVVPPEPPKTETPVEPIVPPAKVDTRITVSPRVGAPAILIALPGFTDIEDDSTAILAKKKDDVTITIFAEKIPKTTSSDDCRDYYLPSVKDYLEYMESLGYVESVSDLSKEERGNMSIVYHDVNFKFSDDVFGTTRSLNSYMYTSGYCWDIHISKTVYEDSMIPFDDILDSIGVSGSAE